MKSNNNLKATSHTANRIVICIDALIMIAAIFMGIVFINLTPSNQNIVSFCEKSSNVSQWDCETALSTNSNIATSSYISNAVTCFGVAVVALLFLVNQFSTKTRND